MKQVRKSDACCCRETAKEIASALAYLHSLNILHGDLSGGNILLTSSNKDPRKFTCKVSLRRVQPTYPIPQMCIHQLLKVCDIPAEYGDLHESNLTESARGRPTSHVAGDVGIA